MSVGGWNEGVRIIWSVKLFKFDVYLFILIFKKSTNFNSIVSSDATLTTFCQSAITTARTYNLDGLDIDWFKDFYNTIFIY